MQTREFNIYIYLLFSSNENKRNKNKYSWSEEINKEEMNHLLVYDYGKQMGKVDVRDQIGFLLETKA